MFWLLGRLKSPLKLSGFLLKAVYLIVLAVNSPISTLKTSTNG